MGGSASASRGAGRGKASTSQEGNIQAPDGEAKNSSRENLGWGQQLEASKNSVRLRAGDTDTAPPALVWAPATGLPTQVSWGIVWGRGVGKTDL